MSRTAFSASSDCVSIFDPIFRSFRGYSRKEGINQNLYYRWSKDFLEAGKKRLAGDTAREASSDEVKGLRAEPSAQGAAGRADAGEPSA
jgi:transposase-like protein